MKRRKYWIISLSRAEQPAAYLVYWAGFQPEHDRREPEAAMRNCSANVRNNWQEKTQKGQAPSSMFSFALSDPFTDEEVHTQSLMAHEKRCLFSLRLK